MLENSQLGKQSTYQSEYDPKLLFAIPRSIKRHEIGIDTNNPGFYGVDIWNHYEISWLNAKGKPMVAIGEISYMASSPNIIESKSMKLYFNSFNNTKFNSIESLIELVESDLSTAIGDIVKFKLFQISSNSVIQQFQGSCLDDLDISFDTYMPNSDFLATENSIVEEELYSNLLKSNCLITGQPDWGSIWIKYSGLKINHAGLLQYIVSLRNHNEFHEQCIERIFNDIMKQCNPNSLSVYARYTRRGGLDINPYRSTDKNLDQITNLRLLRQ